MGIIISVHSFNLLQFHHSFILMYWTKGVQQRRAGGVLLISEGEQQMDLLSFQAKTTHRKIHPLLIIF